MTNGQGLDFGRVAQQEALREAQQKAMIRGYVAETAKAIYVAHAELAGMDNGELVPCRSAIDMEEKNKRARQQEAELRLRAKNAHIAARYLAEEVFGIKFEEK